MRIFKAAKTVINCRLLGIVERAATTCKQWIVDGLLLQAEPPAELEDLPPQEEQEVGEAVGEAAAVVAAVLVGAVAAGRLRMSPNRR